MRKTLSEKLQKLQNRAARILTSSSYDADAGYLLQQLGWKDMIAQRQIQVALMVFKALNDLVPDYLSSMFTERSTQLYKQIKGLFTWREEDPNTRKIREGGKTFRLLYMQKFRPKWLPSGEGKEE